MDVLQLKKELNILGVPHRWYSINGNLNNDIHILNHVHTYWEYFYVDERGMERNHKRFNLESDACEFFLEKMKFNLEFWENTKIQKKNSKSNEQEDTKEKSIIYL